MSHSSEPHLRFAAFPGVRSLQRYLRHRHDRRRIDQLRADPHLARDIGLSPPRPDADSLRRRTDWRSRW